MVTHHHRHKRHALDHARKLRIKGFEARVYPRKLGYSVHVTRR